MFILNLSPRFSFYLLACVYTEGGVGDFDLSAGLVSVGPKILCNNNRSFV